MDIMSRYGIKGTISAAFTTYRQLKGFELPYYLLKKPETINDCANTVRMLLNQNSFLDLYAYSENAYVPVNGFKEKIMSFFTNSKLNHTDIVNAFSSNSDSGDIAFLVDEQSESFYESFIDLAMRCDSFDIYPQIEVAEVIVGMNYDEIKELCRFIENNCSNCIIGTTDDEIHRDMDGIDIIIDYGGNDTYIITRPNILIIDMSGNDIYRGRVCYADKGTAFLLDLEGDDLYTGDDFSVGFAVMGAAVINDRSGNDMYGGGLFSLGAGICGMAIILDESGDDSYISSGYSQGMGMYKGIGIIADQNGHDNYLVSGGIEDHRETGYHAHLSQGFGFGIRDIASGGLGILYDASGNDSYTGEYFVQGASYFYALGMLLDDNGNDVYISRRYSQGAGIHQSSGLLCDIEGNDTYTSWGVSQGCGHDWGTGMLCDYKGDDTYISNWLSMGVSNASGIGLLADLDGNDYYSYTKTSAGYCDTLSRYPGMGILYDMGGKAMINGVEAETSVNGKWGICIHE